MEMIKRFLSINLPAGQSAFLWGPRLTGKSTFLKQAFPKSLVFDFLESDTYLEFIKNPSLLRQQLLARKAHELAQPIILDEVQKVPHILDEVHWLIENKGLRFVLCGSSARKLKRGQANLLGGRAWRYEMFPLTSVEIKNIDLLRSLNQGLIPRHYLQKEYNKSLDAYVKDYLKEEVFHEGLTRNIPAFSRFFDSLGYSLGELTNFSNIARDCGVDSKTVKEYYQILTDTLLGTMIEPFKKRQSRQVISKAGKFYLFDVGIAGFLSRRILSEERGELFGKAFEHFILMELLAHRSYKNLDYPISFWRTKSGLEVDFVLFNGEVAVEVKGKNQILKSDLNSIRAFKEEFKPKHAVVVCLEKRKRIVEGISVIPWPVFLEELWSGLLLGVSGV